MTDFLIQDKRTIKDFTKNTFSNYKKSKVKTQLLKCINTNKIEESCYWSSELICSGHFIELWEIIILYASKYVHLGNPKLPLYLSARIDIFKQILENKYIGNELELRNNQQIRYLFSEIVTILCLSRKNHTFNQINIKDDNDFNIIKITNKLKAPDLSYIKGIFQENDPQELLISVNELSYNIFIKNNYTACYWIEWILKYRSICKKNKQICKIQQREYIENTKYRENIIWIIWDILLFYSKKNNHIHEIMKSLLSMYCLKFSEGIINKRKYIFYFALSLLTNDFDNSIKIYENINVINKVKNKINLIYYEICENNQSCDIIINTSKNIKQKKGKNKSENEKLNKTMEKLKKVFEHMV